MIDVPPDTFNPMTTDDLEGGSIGNVEGGSEVNNEVSMGNVEIDSGVNNKVAFNMGDTSMIGGSEINNIDFVSMLNSEDNIARRAVEPRSGENNVIDLRTAQRIANVEDTSDATAKLTDQVANLDPSKGTSLYELYVRSG